jgi:hypothetical protein
VRRDLGCELRNVERASVSRVARAREDSRLDAEPLEDRYRCGNASVRVVEGDVQGASPSGERLGGGHRPVPVTQETHEMLLEQPRRNRELVRPRVGDRVIAEYE